MYSVGTIFYLNYLKLAMNINERKVVVDLKSGKISLSRTLRQCHNCQHYAQEAQQLKTEVFLLKKGLAYYQKKQKEMNILCQEIQKTKAKLQAKISLRNRFLYHKEVASETELSSSNRPSFFQDPGLSLQLRAKTAYSYDFKLHSFPTTDRSEFIRLQ